MGQGVRAVMARLANELGERATLRTEQLGAGDERVELVPRNPAAATVAIEHSPDADDEDEEVWVTVADEAAPEEPGDLKWLEMALRAVSPAALRSLKAADDTAWRSKCGRRRAAFYGPRSVPRLDTRPGMAAARSGDQVRAVYLSTQCM
jgi:hypothetical protein